MVVERSQAEALQRDAEQFIREENFEEAVVAATEAIRGNPGLASAYRSRAFALEKLGRFNEAEADSKRGISLARKQSEDPFRHQINIVDEVGSPQYIISLLLTGILGLVVQYFMRYRGWQGVGVNAVIAVIGYAIIIAAGTGGE